MSPKMKPGDLLRFLTPDRADEADGVMWFGGASPVRLFYHRYTGPSVEELTRAMELMARDLVSRAELHDEDIDEAFRGVCRDYMAMARLELKSEGQNGS